MPSALVHDQRLSAEAAAAETQPGFWALTLGSIGVVYGDIGTSPLYALREAVAAAGASTAANESVVIGILSLIIWALIVVILEPHREIVEGC